MKKFIQYFIVAIFVLSVIPGLVVGVINRDLQKGMQVYSSTFGFLFWPVEYYMKKKVERHTDRQIRKIEQLQSSKPDLSPSP